MRVIKFRAWSKETGMVEVFSFCDRVIKIIDPDLQATEKKPRKDLELMQFTGLSDKTGKDIYEGDIIKKENGHWGVIIWNAPFFEVTVSDTQSSLYTREWMADSLIIGNIYETPELLK